MRTGLMLPGLCAILGCAGRAQSPGVVMSGGNEWQFVVAGEAIHLFSRGAAPFGAVYYSRSDDRGRTWTHAGHLLWGPGLAGKTLVAGSTVCIVQDSIPHPWQPDVVSASSVDGGQTWRLPVVVPGSTGSAATAALEGTTLNVLLTQRGSTSAPIHQLRSTDAGATWPTPLQTFTQAGSDPRLVAAGNVVHAMWSEATGIVSRRSTDAGASWQPPATIGSIPVCAPGLVVAGNVVHLAYNTATGVQYNRSANGGVTWQPGPTQISGAAQSLTMRVDGTMVWLVYHDQAIGALVCRRSLDQGATWQAPTVVTGQPPPSALCSSMAVAADGPVCCVFFGTGSAVSRDAGLTWSPGFALPNRQPTLLFCDLFVRGSTILASFVDYYCLTFPSSWNCFVRGTTLVHSTDAGLTWTETYPVLAPQVSRFVGLPDSVGVLSGDYPLGGMWDTLSNPLVFELLYGHQHYGTGKPGSGGLAPVLGAAGEPLLGNATQLTMDGAIGGAAGLIGATLSGPASIALGSGLLLLQPPVSAFWGLTSGAAGVPGAGSLGIGLAIPNAVVLRGLRVDFQGFVLDAGAADGFASSAGLESWVW